ncbi:DUF3043 domain-containing protein [Actinotalea sp. K2]|uniref:DUF3043 domain-containing protein n=1 Tax=Actinotalea sp. K2 TaxID=2939438 RepID=UPI0020181243|nr:DUF3043 domain-containing protein [Actinotalea sp. K2]MCL3860726.1 DUF3043 domain-containing protein [Actinotalea sp. K2]
MFSRNRSTPDPAAASSDPPEPEVREPAPGTAGKGRPTPKRRQAEAARKRPLVPSDRRSAMKNAKAKNREVRDREYRAMQTGDERYLPIRDKGPVRRWVRDHVDARWSVGEFFLPVSMVVVFATFLASSNPQAGIVVLGVLYLVVIVAMIDAFLLGRSLRRGLNKKFGADKVVKGTVMYGVLRSFQIRRTRLPRPQVKRGEFPG